MFYNYSLAPYFFLLVVAFMATMKGLLTLKVRVFESPVGDYTATGDAAALWGGFMLTIGIGSFATLIWLLHRLASS